MATARLTLFENFLTHQGRPSLSGWFVFEDHLGAEIARGEQILPTRLTIRQEAFDAAESFGFDEFELVHTVTCRDERRTRSLFRRSGGHYVPVRSRTEAVRS